MAVNDFVERHATGVMVGGSAPPVSFPSIVG